MPVCTVYSMRLETKTLPPRVSRQYVERRRKRADCRLWLRVRLTEKGRAPAYAHKRFHRHMVRAVVKGLPEPEIV